MSIKVKVTPVTTWERVKRQALHTAGLHPKLGKEIADSWKRRMLLCEHSPIRTLEFDIDIESIRQWVTVHLVRHWLGFIPFVHSQREDRRQLDCKRDNLPQGALNDMSVSVNAQALITESRKRLCMQASKETREAWTAVRDAVKEVDPVMAEKMVPECIYRGFCPEPKTCGFCFSKDFNRQLEEYRKVTDD